MQKNLKECAAKALGENPFSVKKAYIAQSNFRCKEDFFKEVQQKPFRLVAYASCCGQNRVEKISRQRYAEFQRLRLIQLQKLAENSQNASLLKYCQMLLAYHFGTSLENAAFMRMINRAELKTAKSLNEDNATESDIRNFLLISLLFGDKNFKYDKEEEANYLALCDKIK